MYKANAILKINPSGAHVAARGLLVKVVSFRKDEEAPHQVIQGGVLVPNENPYIYKVALAKSGAPIDTEVKHLWLNMVPPLVIAKLRCNGLVAENK